MIYDLGTPAEKVGFQVGWVERLEIFHLTCISYPYLPRSLQHLFAGGRLSHDSLGKGSGSIRSQKDSSGRPLRKCHLYSHVRFQHVPPTDALLERAQRGMQWQCSHSTHFVCRVHVSRKVESVTFAADETSTTSAATSPTKPGRSRSTHSLETWLC